MSLLSSLKWADIANEVVAGLIIAFVVAVAGAIWGWLRKEDATALAAAWDGVKAFLNAAVPGWAVLCVAVIATIGGRQAQLQWYAAFASLLILLIAIMARYGGARGRRRLEHEQWIEDDAFIDPEPNDAVFTPNELQDRVMRSLAINDGNPVPLPMLCDQFNVSGIRMQSAVEELERAGFASFFQRSGSSLFYAVLDRKGREYALEKGYDRAPMPDVRSET